MTAVLTSSAAGWMTCSGLADLFGPGDTAGFQNLMFHKSKGLHSRRL